MKELSDAAIEMLDDMMGDLMDKMVHYPDEYPDEERSAHTETWNAVREEAKRRKFWWAR